MQDYSLFTLTEKIKTLCNHFFHGGGGIVEIEKSHFSTSVSKRIFSH